MSNYTITVRETGYADVGVEADTVAEAEQVVQSMLEDGAVVFDSQSYDYDFVSATKA